MYQNILNIVVPLIAVIAGTVGLLKSRRLLINFGIGHKTYLPVVFMIAVVIMLPFLGFLHNFSVIMLDPVPLSLMIGLIFAAYIYNFFFYKGFVHETLSEVESLMLLVPFFAISFGFIVFPSERELLPILLGLIATASVVWSHYKKGHISFTRDSKYILISIMALGLEYVFVKQLLLFYNHFTLYFVRTIFLTFFLNLLYPVNYFILKKNIWKHLFFVAFAFVIQYNFVFWSIDLNGIVLTNLVMNLLPVSVFMYAYVVYKDHPGWKKITAALIILVCVIISQIIS